MATNKATNKGKSGARSSRAAAGKKAAQPDSQAKKTSSGPSTTNLVIAALGGEGGGVLAEWINKVVEIEGWKSQSTSVPGVAQRTGATIYYLELFNARQSEKEPVMSLFPMSGNVDIVLASEALEAARMVQRGFVTPDRTTLIASDSRIFAVSEKAAVSDGVMAHNTLIEGAQLACKHFLHYDMQDITARHGTVISATLLGALAGSGCLPFARSSWEAAIKSGGGRGIEASLGAFGESFERASTPASEPAPESPPAAFLLPEGTTKGGKLLLKRLQEEFPEPVHQILYQGIVRLADYQDHAYAGDYLDRLKEVLTLDTKDPDYYLTKETGRFLALWMAFEDIARIGQLKIRPERTSQIRAEVRAADGQLTRVNEYLRPQVRELVSFLPPALARLLLKSKACTAFLGLFTKGRVIRTSSFLGFLLFYLLSALRLVRRRSWVFAEETGRITQWLEQVRAAASTDPVLGLEVALCGRLIKGYSNTRERGFASMELILDRLQSAPASVAEVAHLRRAALADDTGEALQAALAETQTQQAKTA